MTHAELRAAVEQAVGSVAFSPPVSIAYCEQVRDALRKTAPGAQIEAYFRGRREKGSEEIVVEARDDSSAYKLVVPIPG